MDITRWSIPKSNWLFSLQVKIEKLYTVSKNKTGRPGVDCGLNYERLIAKFKLKLKKVAKTTRPLRYDLSQIPHDWLYSGVTNRFKGLILVYWVPKELWTVVHNTVQETVTKPSQRKRHARRQNGCLSTFTNSWEKKRSERQGRKVKIYPTESRVSEDKKES